MPDAVADDDQPAAPVTLSLMLNAETPFPEGLTLYVQAHNNAGYARSFWGESPAMQITLPFHNGPGDDYMIVVAVKGYHSAGNFVPANPHVHPTLSFLMLPNDAKPVFSTWADLKTNHPAAARLVAANVTDAEAEARYTALAAAKPLSLASLMNLAAAMDTIGLGGGKTPLDFIREVTWDDTLAQDRFFGYADPAIIPLLQAAVSEGEFEQESEADLKFHPGSTSSYKQKEFAYSNVQLTFHENDIKPIGGTNCVRIEPDMDLYKELVAHGLAEVIPNKLTNGLTNPLAVLALRWIDAVQKGEPMFDPGYSLS